MDSYIQNCPWTAAFGSASGELLHCGILSRGSVDGQCRIGAEGLEEDSGEWLHAKWAETALGFLLDWW